ncbi:hypothetical protein D3C78_1529680 [compost metagenome]
MLANRRLRGSDQCVLQKSVVIFTDVEPADQVLDLLKAQVVKRLGRFRCLHILGLQGFLGLVAALDLQGHPGEMGEVEIQSTDIFQGQLGQRPLAVLEQRLAGVADGGAGRAGGNDNRRD